MEKLENGIITSSLLAEHVIHGVSTKELGNMSFDRSRQGRAPGNFQAFVKTLGINPKKSAVCILPAQHTAIIAHVSKKNDHGRIILTPDRKEIKEWGVGNLNFSQELPDYDQGTDAAVSKSRNLYLALLHADCTPILLYDPQTHYFGLVHSGIIGAVTSILPATVNYLKYHCHVNANNLLAYIGPCICAECYNPTKSRHWQHLEPKLSLMGKCFDLKFHLFNQLLKVGLVKSNIELTKYCTACSNNLFFSNHISADVATEGRQMSIIGLR